MLLGISILNLTAVNRYRRAAMQVVSETRLTASDEAKQEKINFFDNKFTSLIPLKIAYFLR